MVILGDETALLEGIELLRHGGDTGDVLIDVDPPAGTVLVKEDDQGDDVTVIQDFSTSLILGCHQVASVTGTLIK